MLNKVKSLLKAFGIAGKKKFLIPVHLLIVVAFLPGCKKDSVPDTGPATEIQIAAGGTHSLILKTDNTLWATGYNEFGQSGDGTNTDRSNYAVMLIQ